MRSARRPDCQRSLQLLSKEIVGETICDYGFSSSHRCCGLQVGCCKTHREDGGYMCLKGQCELILAHQRLAWT